MTERDPPASKSTQRKQIDLKEPIYIIESPSTSDLFLGRNEGDALARTLALGEVESTYYLAVDAEHLNAAFVDIGTSVLKQRDGKRCMPFIHISAHGSEDGIELSDGDCLFWDMLTKRLCDLDERIGGVFENDSGPAIPRTSICFSSCSAFANYNRSLGKHRPFQLMVGPQRDIGWCQSLVAFSTFYYRAFVASESFEMAIDAMNAASVSGQEPLFSSQMGFDYGVLQALGAKSR